MQARGKSQRRGDYGKSRSSFLALTSLSSPGFASSNAPSRRTQLRCCMGGAAPAAVVRGGLGPSPTRPRARAPDPAFAPPRFRPSDARRVRGALGRFSSCVVSRRRDFADISVRASARSSRKERRDGWDLWVFFINPARAYAIVRGFSRAAACGRAREVAHAACRPARIVL